MYSNNQFRNRVPMPVKGILVLAFIALVFFLLGNIIVFLWNEVLVEVTGVKTINFWQALGLFLLGRILFGGFRFSGGRRRKWQQKRRMWKEKWMDMNEEERAEFKAKWKARCGKTDES